MFYVYAVYFNDHPELGYFVGYSKNKLICRMRVSILANTQNSQTKMAKAIKQYGSTQMMIHIIEQLDCSKAEIRERVFAIMSYYNTVEKGLNEQPNVKVLRRHCPLCEKYYSSRTALNRHKKLKHGATSCQSHETQCGQADKSLSDHPAQSLPVA